MFKSTMMEKHIGDQSTILHLYKMVYSKTETFCCNILLSVRIFVYMTTNDRDLIHQVVCVLFR